jgi:hypothetical protein
MSSKRIFIKILKTFLKTDFIKEFKKCQISIRYSNKVLNYKVRIHQKDRILRILGVKIFAFPQISTENILVILLIQSILILKFSKLELSFIIHKSSFIYKL